MNRKSIGKGHTLFDDQCLDVTGIWVLIAESCHEISKTLILENSYAANLQVGLSTFDQHIASAEFTLFGFVRHSDVLLQSIQKMPTISQAIDDHVGDIRRILVRVNCDPYIEPLFFEEGKSEKRHGLLEGIRSKIRESDVIGVGLEGCRHLRPKTYTPSRCEERERAMGILKKNKKIFDLTFL